MNETTTGAVTGEVTYVDHVILAVDDLDAASRDYSTLLGLSVSPGGVHPGAGTQNRLIVLDPAYIELIARVPDTPLSPTAVTAPMFARAPGPIGFALACESLAATVAARRNLGLTLHGPDDGRLQRADGSVRGWQTARIIDGLQAWRLPFLIQHDSAGLERRRRLAAPADLSAHPLGARRLAHITVAVADLEAAMQWYCLAFGLTVASQETDQMLCARTARLPLRQGAIVLAAPLPGDGPIARGLAAQGDGLFSLAIAVDDLPMAVALLRGRGVGVRVEEPDGVLVAARIDPVSSHGARLELVRASDTRATDP